MYVGPLFFIRSVDADAELNSKATEKTAESSAVQVLYASVLLEKG